MQQCTFKLTKAPRSTGGVKYEATVAGETRPWAIYIPQSLCRLPDNGFAPSVTLSISLNAGPQEMPALKGTIKEMFDAKQ